MKSRGKEELLEEIKNIEKQIEYLKDRNKQLHIELFYNEQSYRSGDVVVAKVLIANKVKDVVGKLELVVGDNNYCSWDFYPKKADGSFSKAKRTIYKTNIVRLFKKAEY